MKLFTQSLRVFFLMTLITGLGYPILINLTASQIYKFQADGSILKNKGVNVGSALIAQKFEKPKYFWPRPSSIDYNPIPSGATNLGPTSQDLKKQIEDRKSKFGGGIAPQDLLTVSGSGLDPHITPQSALIQVKRVAQARNMGSEGEKKVISLIDSLTEKRDFGVLGEPRVNVLKLNLALDSLTEKN